MVRLSKPCSICKVKVDKDDMDKDGRCPSCQTVRASIDKGVSYGHYQQSVFSEKQKQKADQERKERQILAASANWHCRNCGKQLEENAYFGAFCSELCKKQWKRKDINGHKTEEIIFQEPEDTGNNGKKCLMCGKLLSGRQIKYCSELCKYNYIQEHQYQRVIKSNIRHQQKLEGLLKCAWCGKPITTTSRSKYCSQECSNAMKNARRMEKKQQERAAAIERKYR